ncbi:MAG: peptidylprolyl isomerase [Lautropia sp.]
MSRFPLRPGPTPHGLRPTLASTLFATIASVVLLAAAPDADAAGPNPQVLMKTSLGDIVIELYPQKAPKTVANFLKYVDDGFYSDTVFHRVIGNFMIQGGGMKKDLSRKDTRPPIPLESQNGLKNDKGAIAMARTNVPESATSQFFINTADNASLNYPQPDGHGYAVFGKVVKGIETVEKIAAVKTGRQGMHGDVPLEPVMIESVSRVQN